MYIYTFFKRHKQITIDELIDAYAYNKAFKLSLVFEPYPLSLCQSQVSRWLIALKNEWLGHNMPDDNDTFYNFVKRHCPYISDISDFIEFCNFLYLQNVEGFSNQVRKKFINAAKEVYANKFKRLI